jgi:hypothetical protein
VGRSRGIATVAAIALGALVGSAGTALAAPSVVTPNPASVDYGDHDVHDGVHPSTTVTLTNTSGTAATVSGVALQGADASQFTISLDGCTGLALGGGGDSCAVHVDFAPTSVGAKAATLVLTDDTGTVEVPLTGTGITGTLSPGLVTFQPQPTFFGDPQAQLSLTNVSGTAQVHAAAYAFTGPDASRFYLQFGDGCFNQTYFPGNTCFAGIAMHAARPGTYQAQLEVTNDGTVSPVVIPLVVTELRGAQLVTSPGQAVFGDVPVGEERTRPVAVRNDGDTDMQVQQVFMATGLPNVFSLTGDTCSSRVIAPGGTCGVVVHFAPGFAGHLNAAVFFIVGNQPTPVTIFGVSGNGVGAAVPVPAPGPTPAPTPPAASPKGRVRLSGKARVGATLRCTPVGYAEGVSFGHRWLRNGRPIAGATRATFRLRAGDAGSRIACRLVARNGAGAQRVTSARSGRIAARR